MSNSEKIQILKNYVATAKVMQLATVNDNTPWLCHVWYVLDWPNQRLLYTSQLGRNHSQHIGNNSNVAGAILNIPLIALGQKVQGVTFIGSAYLINNVSLDADLALFLARWPTESLTSEKVKHNEIPNRLYEVKVSKWILHDEIHFPLEPRYEVDSMIANKSSI